MNPLKILNILSAPQSFTINVSKIKELEVYTFCIIFYRTDPRKLRILTMTSILHHPLTFSSLSLVATDCKTDTCEFCHFRFKWQYGSTHYAPEVQRQWNILRHKTLDLVSTGDHVQEEDYQAMWDSFHRVVTNP